MSDRTDELTRQVQEQTGVRYTQALVEIKQRKGKVSTEDARNAAAFACLNRKDRRRMGLRA